MNKSIHQGLSVLDLSKIPVYDFWSDYTKMKPEGKLCYTDTDSFIVYIKTEDIYIGVAKNVK